MDWLDDANAIQELKEEPIGSVHSHGVISLSARVSRCMG